VSATCVPVNPSASPATAEQIKSYIAALGLARTQRQALAERAARRAAGLVTPVNVPGASPTAQALSSTLVFPLSDPGQNAFTSTFTGYGLRLTSKDVHGDIDILAPADVSFVGYAQDTTTFTVYMESRGVTRLGLPATLGMVVRAVGTFLSPTSAAPPRGGVPDPQLSFAGDPQLTYMRVSYARGATVAQIGRDARVSLIDVAVRWYREDDAVEFGAGYPSALQGWERVPHMEHYGIQPPPTPRIEQVATAYDVNPRIPYGYSWGTCRPAGWPIDGPKVGTGESSSAVLALAIEQAVALLLARYPILAGVPNFAREATAIVDAVAITEGAGRLWLPQNGFDIRPRKSEGVSASNRLDEGPHPRTYKWHTVDSAYRPADKQIIVSPIGPFQMTVSTFRGEYDRRVRDGTFVGDDHEVGKYDNAWLWDAPLEYQLLLPSLKLIEEVYVPTAPSALGGRLFPPIYRALAIYAINAFNSVGRQFIAEAALAVNALPVTATQLELHLACKRVWDSGTGALGTWAYFSGFKSKHANMISGIGQKLALSGSSLPTKHPDLFSVPPGGLPAPRARVV
jgi:hypothetical protein